MLTHRCRLRCAARQATGRWRASPTSTHRSVRRTAGACLRLGSPVVSIVRCLGPQHGAPQLPPAAGQAGRGVARRRQRGLARRGGPLPPQASACPMLINGCEHQCISLMHRSCLTAALSVVTRVTAGCLSIHILIVISGHHSRATYLGSDPWIGEVREAALRCALRPI